MILEHAWLPVTPGREGDFESAMRRALPVIESAPDCAGAEVRRQLEDPSVYLLTVRWSSYEAHMAFRGSDLYVTWREMTHPFYREPAVVTHFEEPLER